MEALSVREYRNNLAASFTKADNGEHSFLHEGRKNAAGSCPSGECPSTSRCRLASPEFLKPYGQHPQEV